MKEFMLYGAPPLFKQSIPARARLVIYVSLAVILILVDSRLRVLEPLRVNIRTFLSPIHTVVNFPFQAVNQYSDFFVNSTSVSDELERLRLENQTLKIKIAQTEELIRQNEQLRELLSLQKQTVGQTTLLAQVLGAVGDRFSRNLKINKGTSSGVRLGMPVLDNQGLLGQVVRVYPDQSEVFLITSKEAQVPVQIERTGLRAICEGVGETDTLRLLFVTLDADIQVGDRIITSGIDGVFPRNTPVGSVISVVQKKSSRYAEVLMRPLATAEQDAFVRVALTSHESFIGSDPLRKKVKETP